MHYGPPCIKFIDCVILIIFVTYVQSFDNSNYSYNWTNGIDNSNYIILGRYGAAVEQKNAEYYEKIVIQYVEF